MGGMKILAEGMHGCLPSELDSRLELGFTTFNPTYKLWDFIALRSLLELYQDLLSPSLTTQLIAHYSFARLPLTLTKAGVQCTPYGCK